MEDICDKRIRCPNCNTNGAFIRHNKSWDCNRCGFSRPRRLKEDFAPPTFLSIVVPKTEKDKKLLEDITAEKPKNRWKIFREGHVFFYEEGKIVNTMTIFEYAMKMAKEVEERDKR
jgi:ribosomal protein S27AE